MNEDIPQSQSIFKISAKVCTCDLGQNLKMDKTSHFCSIHQEDTYKSSSYSNLIIFTDFHSFTVNEEKLQNLSILKFSAKVRVCDLSQNLIMTKTSLFFSIHQENICKSSFHLNLIIFTDLHSFTVKEDKLQN